MEFIRETPPPILAEHGIEFFFESKPTGITAHLHIHPAIEFIYVKQGLFHIEVEKQTIRASAGDLILFHSNAIHMIENIGVGTGQYYVLKISPSLLFEMLHKSSIPYIQSFFRSRNEDACHFPRESRPPQIDRLWAAMIAEYDAGEPTFFAMQRLLACEFLLTCARLLPAPHDVPHDRAREISERSVRLISDSINYINANFSAPLTAAGCASLAHLSYNHYAKLFRAVTGKTFKEYLTDLRMARAYHLILSSAQPIYEIAAACGYDNYSYFIVEFKKMYGCTPGQLRRRAKEADEE